jgi:hypothetical protein
MTEAVAVFDRGMNDLRVMRDSDLFPLRMRDVLGRAKVSQAENIYEADFEYGAQPLRWETLTSGGGSTGHAPGLGGVVMSVNTSAGAVAIRQSRPYLRYQPGKAMAMATAIVMGPAIANNRQRMGFFDDTNGVFFEQGDPDAANGNPSGMFVVMRTDTSGLVVDTRVPLTAWNGPQALIATLDWARIQMVFVEYAWYGAGTARWGVMINGEPHILHQIARGNAAGMVMPWARTGNLPVRYETRNLAATASGNTMTHWGVSVMVEGRVDAQRGFTYSYGMAPATPRRTVGTSQTRFPVLSIRNRTMGVVEFNQANSAVTAGTTSSITLTGTPLTVDQFRGRAIFFPGLGGGNGLTARITGNTTSVLSFGDIVTGAALGTAPAASAPFQIGLLNRGQILPRNLVISANQVCLIELIASIPGSPVVLTGPTWASLASLGSTNSFAERDVSATALTGGEIVYAFTAPAGGSGVVQIELNDLFPLLNTIRGNLPDILTVAVTTTTSAADVGVHIVGQEAMS